MKEILKEISDNELAVIVEIKRALIAMNNMQDAAVIDLTIGDQAFKIPLAITELFWGFEQFLVDAANSLS